MIDFLIGFNRLIRQNISQSFLIQFTILVYNAFEEHVITVHYFNLIDYLLELSIIYFI